MRLNVQAEQTIKEDSVLERKQYSKNTKNDLSQGFLTEISLLFRILKEFIEYL